MTDLKNMTSKSQKVSLRWWWFDIDVRQKRTAFRDFVSGVVVLLIGALIAIMLTLIGWQSFVGRS